MRIQTTKGWSGSWELCKVVHLDEKKMIACLGRRSTPLTKEREQNSMVRRYEESLPLQLFFV